MSSKLLLGLALVLSGGLFTLSPAASVTGASTSSTSTTSQPQKLVHNWEYITFPWSLPDGKSCPNFLVGWPGPSEHSGEDSQGFRLDIFGIPLDFFKTNAITARLYRANGEIVEPTVEGRKLLNSPMYFSMGSIPGMIPNPQVMTYFPLGMNTLEECWVEVSMGTERYWVEIPYGFDRNPNEPLPPSIPGGPPQFVPAMKSLTDHDHAMRWQTVHYDLGVIQNGWRLSLIQSNSVDAESEVILYREDVKIGTATSWETNSPTTALRILDAGETTIGSHCIDVHIQDGGMERCNTYDIARNGDGQRCWGQIEISVDDKSYRVVVPSSLYKYTHGHASTH